MNRFIIVIQRKHCYVFVIPQANCFTPLFTPITLGQAFSLKNAQWFRDQRESHLANKFEKQGIKFE